MRISLRPNHRPEVLIGAARATLYIHKRLVLVLSILFGIFMIVYGKTLFHITKEFITHSNFNFNLCKRFHQTTHAETRQSSIPKVIHQVFLNASDDSEGYFELYKPYRESWRRMNPGYRYILWNETMVVNLINTSYPSVMPLYKRYKNIWLARADIARYVVVHFMGGVYADIDIECKRPMDLLLQEIGEKKVALNYSYNPFGIANDFFISSKHHEFMAHVIDGLAEADVLYFTPYINTMFRTGPMYLLGRYLNYIHQDDIFILQKSQVYISNDNKDTSVHGIDGRIIHIIWASIDSLQLISVIVMIVFIVRLNKLLSVRKKLIHKSKSSVYLYENYSKLSMSPIMEEEPL
ncbi:uncharacterized protein LOC128222887 [Mya arenaria]|uniref:uncharacterized protein LOC128222887 n=1 Tax=Mya arenaria TaxID=6604 RepID=UPI0022E1CA2C|nr:uncharacterized protein LOC128222887 [Mya arenaria]XP_052788020.1 uncharacterized protein LOC128222887 [Mya arenaria]